MLTREELDKAFKLWLMRRSAMEVELAITPFLSDKMKPFAVGKRGWLKIARNELSLSTATVAKNMNVARAAYAMYEESEEKGAITLGTLAKAAAAMGCEVVYAVRPINRKYFSRIVWEILLPASMQDSWLKNCDPKRKAEALAAVAGKLFKSSKFRKTQAWSQHKNVMDLYK